MPRPVSDALRNALWQRSGAGESTPQLAASLALPLRTAQHLLATFRRHGGPQPPRYASCGRWLAPQRLPAQQLALDLRRQHPDWGAGRIQTEFQRRHLPAPARRTIRRWLADAGLAPPGPLRQPDRARLARQVHEIWQMDAAEQIPLATGQRVSWLRLVDERSGAVLQTVVFPPGELGRGQPRAGAAGVASGLGALGPAVVPESR